MPIYEYFCAKCGAKFEELRAAARADDAATCPSGHRGATRVLSVFARVGRGGTSESASMTGGGGCGCGGACACGGH
jgi:putative FmdB family regulatory protein